MKALEKLEAVLQEVVERPQWLLTPRRLHPLTIASAIARALDDGSMPVGDRVLAPNRYNVDLHPDDFRDLAEVQRTLERELALYVGRLAEERGVGVQPPVEVRFSSGGAARAGSPIVIASFSDASRSAPPVLPESLGGLTERMDRSTLPPLLHEALNTARLELLDDSGRTVRVFGVTGPIATIGRRSSNDVPLLDLEVSRQHARIDFVAPRFFLSDLGSTNGTRVNGRVLAGRHTLRDGDLIELGRQRLRFRASA